MISIRCRPAGGQIPLVGIAWLAEATAPKAEIGREHTASRLKTKDVKNPTLLRCIHPKQPAKVHLGDRITG